jgi:hypothetical protein
MKTPGSGMALARGGQQSVQSCACELGLHVCPCQAVVHVSQVAM